MADETTQDAEQQAAIKTPAQFISEARDAVTSGIQSTLAGLNSEKEIIETKMLTLDQQIASAESSKARIQRQLDNANNMIEQFTTAKRDLASMRDEHIASIRRWEDIRDGRKTS